MKDTVTLEIDEELASRIDEIDTRWLSNRLETLADEYEKNAADSSELAAYQSQKEIREDESISAAERKRRLIKWRRQVGSRHRL